MKANLKAVDFYSAPRDKKDREFNSEMYMKHIRRTSLLGQLIIILITLLVAGSAFAQDGKKSKRNKKNFLGNNVSSIHFFKKQMYDNTAFFTWTCIEDSMPYKLLIQKSRNGADFKTVYAYAVDSYDKKMKFSCLDQNLAQGLSYYRVTKIREDAKIEFSPLIQIFSSTENDDGLAEYPASATAVPIE